MARATATILRWPPLKCSPCRASRFFTSGNTANACSSGSARGPPRFLATSSPSQRLIIRFSATDSSGNTPQSSGE